MKRQIVVLLLIFTLNAAFGTEQKSYAENLACTFSYYGEFVTHPGISTGLEYIIYERSFYQAVASSAFTIYYHRKNHTGLFGDTALGSRFTAPFGLAFDLFAGIGYYHYFVDGRIYYRDASGQIVQKPNYGNPAFLVELSFSLFEWDFAKNNLIPLTSWCRLHLFGIYPYNGYMLPHIGIQIGGAYRFKQIKRDVIKEKP